LQTDSRSSQGENDPAITVSASEPHLLQSIISFSASVKADQYRMLTEAGARAKSNDQENRDILKSCGSAECHRALLIRSLVRRAGRRLTVTIMESSAWPLLHRMFGGIHVRQLRGASESASASGEPGDEHNLYRRTVSPTAGRSTVNISASTGPLTYEVQREVRAGFPMSEIAGSSLCT